MKQIHITFPNGEVWRIPAQVVAEDRARFFSTQQFGKGHVADNDLAYQAELKFALRHDDELVDYVQNNMNWQHVRHYASRVSVPETYDYAEAFDSATFEVKGE